MTVDPITHTHTLNLILDMIRRREIENTLPLEQSRLWVVSKEATMVMTQQGRFQETVQGPPTITVKRKKVSQRDTSPIVIRKRRNLKVQSMSVQYTVQAIIQREARQVHLTEIQRKAINTEIRREAREVHLIEIQRKAIELHLTEIQRKAINTEIQRKAKEVQHTKIQKKAIEVQRMDTQRKAIEILIKGVVVVVGAINVGGIITVLRNAQWIILILIKQTLTGQIQSTE